MNTKIIKQTLNGVTLIYATRDGVTTFTCVPSNMEDRVLEHRLLKTDWSVYQYLDPACQVALSGDGVKRDFSAGYTLFNADTSFSLKLVDSQIEETYDRTTVTTTFENESGLKAVQKIVQIKPYTAFEMSFEVTNGGEDVELEKLSSFMIGAISPFQNKNDPDTIFIHELKNYWSCEGRLKSKSLSELDFEDSWVSLGLKVERIGATGMMPARGYIPFIAVEDRKSRVTWGVQLETIGSWQIEAIQKYGAVSINGGLADFNFGHFRKTIKHGETFRSTKAYISVVDGDLTECCSSLTRYQDNLIEDLPTERDLPIVYNEYLNTWGNPTMELFYKLIPAARKLGCEYFVSDSGWYITGDGQWATIGNWDIDYNDFPNGLGEYAEYAKSNGMKAVGIWYEYEGVSETSNIYKDHKDWLLTLNGKLIKRDTRYLLDFRKQEVIDYLTEKVINNLKNSGLNYVKVDYNEDVGIGCDGAESIGEGLRKHAEAVLGFFKKMKKEIPGLVIENCSSGGMRHSVNFDTVGGMTSFSDSHECLAGATIAMDSHRYLQPRINQIWVSLLPAHSVNETYFTLVKGMLGRPCYSGPIEKMNVSKQIITSEASKFYELLKPLIRNGKTTFIDTNETTSILNPAGVNRLTRISESESMIAEYVISYGVPARKIDIGHKGYAIEETFGNCIVDQKKNLITVLDNEICAEIVILRKK